jgi:hypothetical protein
MRKRIVGLTFCVVLVEVCLQADDKPGDARVKELEAHVRAAESEFKKATELLAAIKAAWNNTRCLEGVWRIVSVNGNRPGGTFVKHPYDEYKIMTAGDYLWLSFDPHTGKVLRSGGGTCALDGENYTAHVDYSNADDLRAVVGLGYKGACRL